MFNPPIDESSNILTRNLQIKKNERKANASAKSKELQPNEQSQRFAAHLFLPQPHNLTFDNPKLILHIKCQERRKKVIGFP